MSYKIYSIFMVLVLTQAACGKSIDTANTVDSSEEVKDVTPKQALMIYALGTFLLMGQELGEKSVQLSHKLLKDESLLAHDKAEVLEFKKNITLFVEKFDANKDSIEIWDILEIYSNATDHYLELPVEKLTPESKFIVDLLNKYHAKEVETEFVKEFDVFVENFKKMFVEAKMVLEKPLLDWYEKFVTITKFEDKLNAFGGFIELSSD